MNRAPFPNPKAVQSRPVAAFAGPTPPQTPPSGGASCRKRQRSAADGAVNRDYAEIRKPMNSAASPKPKAVQSRPVAAFAGPTPPQTPPSGGASCRKRQRSAADGAVNRDYAEIRKPMNSAASPKPKAVQSRPVAAFAGPTPPQTPPSGGASCRKRQRSAADGAVNRDYAEIRKPMNSAASPKPKAVQSRPVAAFAGPTPPQTPPSGGASCRKRQRSAADGAVNRDYAEIRKPMNSAASPKPKDGRKRISEKPGKLPKNPKGS